MRNQLTLVVFLAAAALLQGCVRSQLLRQETQAFATTADRAAAAGAKFYEELIESDRDLYAMFYALDASCRPPSINRGVYWLKKARTKNPDRWCSDKPASDTITLSAAFSHDSFEREFSALAFTATYITALTELAADHKATAATQFADAAADINTLLAAAKKDPVLNKDQIEAASSLFGFLQEISASANSAREIRSLLDAHGVKAKENLDLLSEALLMDSAFVDADLEAKIGTATSALNNGKLSDPFLRHSVLASYYRAIDIKGSLNAFKKKCEANAEHDVKKYCGAKAAGLMHIAAVAHKDLLNLATGNLNAEQKAKEAKLAYARFISAVRLFVSLTAAF